MESAFFKEGLFRQSFDKLARVKLKTAVAKLTKGVVAAAGQKKDALKVEFDSNISRDKLMRDVLNFKNTRACLPTILAAGAPATFQPLKHKQL